MAISDRQREFRRRRLGSSDATRIMAGDWYELWLEKTGRTDAPRLDHVPAVQIGISTEHLHPHFWYRRTGIPALPADGRSYTHPVHDWIVCHPDFLTWSMVPPDPFVRPDTILEAKFCSGPDSDEDLAERYYWQVQHQLLVTGHQNAVLSILRPSTYSSIPVPPNRADQERLLETLTAFWWHVENDVEPGDPLPVPAPDLDSLHVVDMRLHNAFATQAATLLTHRDSVTAYKAAEVELKSLMPDDARVAFVPGDGDHRGLHLNRSRDGRLSLRFGSPTARHMAKARPWSPPLPDYAIDVDKA